MQRRHRNEHVIAKVLFAFVALSAVVLAILGAPPAARSGDAALDAFGATHELRAFDPDGREDAEIAGTARIQRSSTSRAAEGAPKDAARGAHPRQLFADRVVASTPSSLVDTGAARSLGAFAAASPSRARAYLMVFLN